MRVWQETDVEHEVRVDRHTEFEPKTDDGDQQVPGCILLLEHLDDVFPEFMDGGVVTAPNVAIWTKDGFVVENKGVTPDIEVEQTPSEVIHFFFRIISLFIRFQFLNQSSKAATRFSLLQVQHLISGSSTEI